MSPHPPRCSPSTFALAFFALTLAAVAQESPPGLKAGANVTPAAAATSSPPLVITSARVDHPANAVTIVGRNFGATKPTATLGAVQLHITSHGPTLVVAHLPASMMPGTYRLTLSTGETSANTDTIAVTIGADAPGGPQGRKSNGAPCTEGRQCVSGHCADNVCCESRCSGTCEKCNLAGREGFCAAVPSGQDPDNECPNNVSACQAGVCTGTRACKVSAAGAVCAPASCNGKVSNRPDTCNGAGTCVDGGTQNCSPYTCSAATGNCLTRCAGKADCQPGFNCVNGKCLPRPSTPNIPKLPRPPSQLAKDAGSKP